ncbi:MAG: hypothetical protein JSW12_00830 [Deltaproteobacteria bacterium]|nr:MAG: hypothetical protein JSW12_00830 [Deltaproteobacteria bacterium]
MTYRSVDKPAEVPTLKFPCRAILPGFSRTLFNHPTGLVVPTGSAFHGQKKQHLTLDMPGNVPPSLLETLDGF